MLAGRCGVCLCVSSAMTFRVAATTIVKTVPLRTGKTCTPACIIRILKRERERRSALAVNSFGFPTRAKCIGTDSVRPPPSRTIVSAAISRTVRNRRGAECSTVDGGGVRGEFARSNRSQGISSLHFYVCVMSERVSVEISNCPDDGKPLRNGDIHRFI